MAASEPYHNRNHNCHYHRSTKHTFCHHGHEHLGGVDGKPSALDLPKRVGVTVRSGLG